MLSYVIASYLENRSGKEMSNLVLLLCAFDLALYAFTLANITHNDITFQYTIYDTISIMI